MLGIVTLILPIGLLGYVQDRACRMEVMSWVQVYDICFRMISE
jgi:hypothetical protein